MENRLLRDKPDVLTTLLADHTTQQRIFWACNSYADLGEGYAFSDPMTVEAITGDHAGVIRPRAVKAREEQQQRSREMAEVFTPSWLCNEMNNEADAQWFGRTDVFNSVGDDHQWQPQPAPIAMPEGKTWQDYALTTRLEITCGEAPFLVSRYDTVTGEAIALDRRIGILDRKLRVVGENAADETEWTRWALVALGSCYGYEWQGDSLLLAREAVVETFVEYYEQRFRQPISDKLLAKAAEIVSWNLWQMDGLKGVVPCSCKSTTLVEPTLFGEPKVREEHCPGCASDDITLHNGLYCQLRRWIADDKSTMPDHFDLSFLDILTKKYKTYHKTKWLMKFDFIIGNPPYQDETLGDNKGFAPPIYDKFIDGAYQLSDKVELIHPARFLFNAGSTPTQWNKKMLNDSHLKVLAYEEDAAKIFPNTEIKGGVAVTLHDKSKDFGAIGIYTPFKELNLIIAKIHPIAEKSSLSDIGVSGYSYHFTEKMHKDYPQAKTIQSEGHESDLKSNVIEKLPFIFHKEKPNDGQQYAIIIGRVNNERVSRFIKREYLNDVVNFDSYKLLLPKASGIGKFGEELANCIVAEPNTGNTETFFSIGSFKTKEEATNLYKYLKSKFARALLSVTKKTQMITPRNFKYVPLQDFTSSSDIDWSKSIHEIDLQLYDKYGLTDAERSFIETHVKPME